MAASANHQSSGVTVCRSSAANGRGPKRFKKVENAQALIWKMLLVAEKRFRRLKAPELMKDVYQGAEYVNGILVNQAPEEKAA